MGRFSFWFRGRFYLWFRGRFSFRLRGRFSFRLRLPVIQKENRPHFWLSPLGEVQKKTRSLMVTRPPAANTSIEQVSTSTSTWTVSGSPGTSAHCRLPNAS